MQIIEIELTHKPVLDFSNKIEFGYFIKLHSNSGDFAQRGIADILEVSLDYLYRRGKQKSI